MKALWLVPLGLLGLVGIAAAASTASASEAKETLPSDIEAMVRAAETSKDPTQLEAVATAIKSKYPKTAATLENEAFQIRKAKGAAAGAAAGTGAQSAGQQAAGGSGTVAASGTGSTAAGTTTATGTTAITTTGAGASGAGSATAPGVPTAVLQELEAALMSADPAKMREVGNKYLLLYPTQAQALLSAAQILAGVQVAAVAGGTSAATGGTATGTAGAANAAATGIGLQRAIALQAAAATWTKNTEDAATIKDYQIAERLKKQDGKYGSQTALSLAETYNLVPPTPLHWGEAGAKNSYKSAQDDKNAYKTRLLSLATKFPAQAAQWRAAANAVK